MQKSKKLLTSITIVLALALAACKDDPRQQAPADPIEQAPPQQPIVGPVGRVVAATFDTGTNPFHPCFRRSGPSALDAIPEIRGIAEPLQLTFKGTYEESLAASQEALDAVRPFTLYSITGTSLLAYTGSRGVADLVDDYPHGALASSQIVCPQYGMAPDTYVVVLHWYDQSDEARHRMELWAAAQKWIDIVHINTQRGGPWPFKTDTYQAIQKMVANGKLVVVAAGNGYGGAAGHILTDTVDLYGELGVVIAGASDQSRYTSFSNLNPHVVMDGCETDAAEGKGFGTTRMSGTSSSSPRITGYASELLRRLRVHYRAPGGTAGSVLLRVDRPPERGPLADGSLTVHEYHEVIRKTADPTLAASWLDGNACWYGVPRPVDPQGHDYHRIGYGKLSEHTIGNALAVLKGEAPMPERPTEDGYYAHSNTVRGVFW